MSDGESGLSARTIARRLSSVSGLFVLVTEQEALAAERDFSAEQVDALLHALVLSRVNHCDLRDP